MVDHQDDDGTRRHRRQFRPATGYDASFGHDAMAPVPGRATSTDRLPSPPPKAAARRALLAVDGAIVRVETMRPRLAAALDARHYLESGRLSLEVRTAIQRAATGLRPYAEDSDHRDAAAAAAERLRVCAANVAPLLERAPALEAPDAGSEAAQTTWEAAAKPPVAEAVPTWDADAQELTRAAGLADVDVKSDDEARSVTDAHGARGLALGSTVYLHPERSKPGSAEGREVLAHELVHLAQAQLGAAESLDDHAAAEQEAAELAPRLARGGAVTPRHRIDLSQPAADNGGPLAASLAEAEKLVASASRNLAVIQHKINANEMNDRPSASLAPELRAIGTMLATARTVIDSTGTVPDPRWKQTQALRARITSMAADVAQAEAGITGTSTAMGTSQVADMMGHEQPIPRPTFTRGPRSGGAISGMQAEAYIRNTPDVHAAIHLGSNGAKLGTGPVIIHDNIDSYAAAIRAAKVAVGRSPEELDAEARREANDSLGATDQVRGIAHVLAKAAPDTTIHELMHVYSHKAAGAGAALPQPMKEAGADYFTELVCTANNLPFEAGYAKELYTFKALVKEVGFAAVASTYFGGAPTLKQCIEALGAGSWRKYRALWAAERFVDAMMMIAGLAEKIAAAEPRTEREDADPSHAGDGTEVVASSKTGQSESTWRPEGQSADGKVHLMKMSPDGATTLMTIGAGGNHGVRDGWLVSLVLESGNRIEGVVTQTMAVSCLVEFPGLVGSEEIGGALAKLRRAP